MSDDDMSGAHEPRGGVHPDEGAIHAWLDGEQPLVVAETIAAHVRACAECADRVAEARGLIAGASRVVAALDEGAARAAPATVLVTPVARASGSGTLWRALRVTPARAAIAAMLLVAVGITLTRRDGVEERPSAPVAASDVEPDAAGATAVDSTSRGMMASSPSAATETATEAATAGARAVTPPVRDALLDSAIRRRVAQTQPPRSVGALPAAAVAGPAIASAAAPAAAAAEPMAGNLAGTAEARVAGGQALRRRMTSGRSAAAAARDTTASSATMADRTAAPAGVLERPTCWRVARVGEEAAEPSWAGDRLPVVVDPAGVAPGVGDTLRLAAANRSALVLGPAGAAGVRRGALRAFDRAGALLEWRVMARPSSCRE